MNEQHEAVEHVTPLEMQAGGGTYAASGAGSLGATTGPFVYAIGRVEARFPTLSAEKEFAQATGRADTAGKTDQQTFHDVLSKRENRYLARQLCWVLTIQGLETYLLQPRDPGDIDLLVEAIRPAPSPNDIDVVIGTRGGIAPPEMCNGLMVPIVAFDQIYSFDRDALIKAIPKPEKTTAAQFARAADELFYRIMQMTDNAGATRRASRLELSRDALSSHLREDGRGIRGRLFLEQRRCSRLTLERHPQHRRSGLLVHQPQYRLHRKVLHARRHHRGVSVPGHQAVALLRPMKQAADGAAKNSSHDPGEIVVSNYQEEGLR